jgi:DNA adenine methylase
MSTRIGEDKYGAKAGICRKVALMTVPHPIPYQGSKRNIANFILSLFPAEEIDTLIEPFAGSGAVSIAAAYSNKASQFYINDLNKPLTDLLDEIINHPQKISESYEKIWREQKGREREYYNLIRDQFNKTKRSDYLLFLLARCVKASVRYNKAGKFNQSPDNRRTGRHPCKMREDIFATSKLLKDKTIISSKDYKEILANKTISKSDLIYMDPPYQGVCGNRDSRYYEGIEFEEFVEVLDDLVKRDLSFILSYDGRRGNVSYGKAIPEKLKLCRIEIPAGRSTQSTLLGGTDITYESLYLSPALVNRINLNPNKVIASKFIDNGQTLLSVYGD